MTTSVKLSTPKFQQNIFLFGLINCAVYGGVLVIFRQFHTRILPSLLVLINCVVLWLISTIQIKRLVKKFGVMKFLRSFSLVFFTGVCAFILFGGFIFSYSMLDRGLVNQLTRADEQLLTSVILIVSEGAGGSMIVALICMFYADQFYDHEKKA